MQSLGIHYYPLTLPFLLALLGVLVVLTSLAVLRVLRFAYSQLGIAPGYFFTWLFLSLAGSYVNLPIMRFAPEQMTRLGEVPFYGVPYVIPTVETRSEEHTSELQSHVNLVCRLLLEKKKKVGSRA